MLSAGSAAAESVLTYAVLVDLLRGLAPRTFAGLPEVQRHALDRVLMRADGSGRPTDQQEVAAGFLAVVDSLAVEAPVLLVVDDLQWLDASSPESPGIRGAPAQRSNRSACFGPNRFGQR